MSPEVFPTSRAACQQVAVHQVTVQVHRHRGRAVFQHALHHLRVGASTQPHRERSMTQIMDSEPLSIRINSSGLSPADRPLPVRLAQRAALRRGEQPGIWCLSRAPPVAAAGRIPDRYPLSVDPR